MINYFCIAMRVATLKIRQYNSGSHLDLDAENQQLSPWLSILFFLHWTTKQNPKEIFTQEKKKKRQIKRQNPVECLQKLSLKILVQLILEDKEKRAKLAVESNDSEF